MYIDLTRNIYSKMHHHQFVMSVMGSFDQDLLKSLIKMTEKKLVAIEADEAIRKKIFHFVVECAQNLCNKETSGKHYDKNLFLIGKKGKDYIIHLGCIYSKSEGNKITELLDSVNKMQISEVKNTFYRVLSAIDLADQNPVLMSVLDISKRTRNKILYEMVPVDTENCFISFNTLITSS